ncbi:MAG: asparagine synthase (glutamine-hydrolyzing) [Oligoflexia bacterium]|nr:asparagine synthase (glutamine-hydrolyzing) [Oligoflexia bacterium]
MCGIAGFASPLREDWTQVLGSMSEVLKHRGPDDFGIWAEPQAGIYFAHRRLSILDLSAEGHQPKASPSKRFMLCFNGEIYNFPELRQLLQAKGAHFRGHSDTEVLLAGFEAWGVQNTLERTVGMFALAVWDGDERRLILARDRMGEKPLYYGWNSGRFFFTSELKALHCHPGAALDVDPDAAQSYFQYWCVPCPLSIFQGIYKLPPGCLLDLSHSELRNRPADYSPDPDGESSRRPLRYWSLAAAVPRTKADFFSGTQEQACDELQELLSGAIKGQLLSDVPLGAFLSGGIDSSTIVALMQQQSSRPIQTFSIGFWEKAFDESAIASEIAQRLGTAHTQLHVTPQDALNVIPLIPGMFDEPFADSSQIPTYLVSKLARQKVTVSLSGDGGDELFGGYTRYNRAFRLWQLLKRVPAPARRGLAAILKTIPQSFFQIVAPGKKLDRAVSLLEIRSRAELYHNVMSLWGDLRVPKAASVLPFQRPDRIPPSLSFMEEMMYQDLSTYLHDDILTKCDRSSMAVSLELRAPFLDHRLVEFVLRLPRHLRNDGRTSKILLRKLIGRFLPGEIFERPKQGFSVPISEWLRGPLRDWAEDLLVPARLKDLPHIDHRRVSSMWQAHITGRRDWQMHLWTVLMYQAWQREQLNSSGKLAKAAA